MSKKKRNIMNNNSMSDEIQELKNLFKQAIDDMSDEEFMCLMCDFLVDCYDFEDDDWLDDEDLDDDWDDDIDLLADEDDDDWILDEDFDDDIYSLDVDCDDDDCDDDILPF